MSALEESLALQMRAAKLPAWQPEYRFHPKRKWRFDFAWPDMRTACEVEGGNWTGGRHTRPQGFESDCEKYSEAALQGWTVLRVTGAMVKDGRALELVERAVGERSKGLDIL